MNYNIPIAVVATFIAIYAGGMTLNAPRKFLVPGGCIGVVCWISYLLVLQVSNNAVASFVSSVFVAVLSNICARYYKAPVTMFFIPGFLPTVPGVAVYRMVYFYITNQHDKGYNYLVATAETAIAIALAIVLVDSLFKAVMKVYHNLKK